MANYTGVYGICPEKYYNPSIYYWDNGQTAAAAPVAATPVATTPVTTPVAATPAAAPIAATPVAAPMAATPVAAPAAATPVAASAAGTPAAATIAPAPSATASATPVGGPRGFVVIRGKAPGVYYSRYDSVLLGGHILTEIV